MSNAVPQTYIVAQNPEVLAYLMKENQKRGINPAAYITPASVFNTVAVDFEKTEDQPEPILRTCPIPIQNLHKLDPEVPPENAVVGTPDSNAKTATLERTPSRTSTSSAGTPKMGSLERKSSSKMNSLERNTHIVNTSHGSLDKAGVFSPKLGSLERKSRNTSPKMGSLERTTTAFSPKMGSLERNAHIINQSISYDCEPIPQYHPEPVLYQYNDKSKDVQQFEESIYDFGGADVKSCAHKQQFFIQNRQQVRIKGMT